MPMPPEMLTVGNVTKPVLTWSAESGLAPGTIRSRLKFGWDPARAVSEPADKRFRGGGRHKNSAPRPVPQLKEHTTGQAYVRWCAGGKHHFRYFGPWGEDATNRAYVRFCNEWMASQIAPEPREPGVRTFVGELIARHMEWARKRYVKHGKSTSEINLMRVALRVLNDDYGDTLIED